MASVLLTCGTTQATNQYHKTSKLHCSSASEMHFWAILTSTSSGLLITEAFLLITRSRDLRA